MYVTILMQFVRSLCQMITAFPGISETLHGNCIPCKYLCVFVCGLLGGISGLLHYDGRADKSPTLPFQPAGAFADCGRILCGCTAA